MREEVEPPKINLDEAESEEDESEETKDPLILIKFVVLFHPTDLYKQPSTDLTQMVMHQPNQGINELPRTGLKQNIVRIKKQSQMEVLFK